MDIEATVVDSIAKRYNMTSDHAPVLDVLDDGGLDSRDRNVGVAGTQAFYGSAKGLKSGVNAFAGVCETVAASQSVIINGPTTAQSWGDTTPATWGNNDLIAFSITYQIA